MNTNEMLVAWKRSKEILDEAKAREMELRQLIVNESGLFSPDKLEGTETIDLGGGWKVKAIKKITYNVNNKDGVCFSVLADISRLSEVDAHVAKDLCSFKPDLRLTKYRELSEAGRRLFDTILTTSPATPSLELVPPKGGE